MPAAVALALSVGAAQATSALNPWVGTWRVTPQSYSSANPPTGKTIRHIVLTSIAARP